MGQHLWEFMSHPGVLLTFGLGLSLFAYSEWMLHNSNKEAAADQNLDELINSRGNTGGLIKRIDENRELLQTLQLKAPQLLVECPWINGWILANDAFFVQLDELMPANGRRADFPREVGGLND